MVNFGYKYVHVPEHYLRDYDRLVMGGVWAQVDIKHQYDAEQKGKKSPFWIEGLKPIQIATFDLAEYRRCRSQFTTDEWIDLLMRSVGLEPSNFERRVKLLFLLRLVWRLFAGRLGLSFGRSLIGGHKAFERNTRDTGHIMMSS